ncbi:hypothetical protein PB2503_06217 [Parvularcula bermudensis HTCC2503]|uniref:Pentapeptide repeat-containing protein n=1 Tax=Parvularcula bermudensis (strain ATCC BAA-594 / HTCC2503 / KCTC 12087) TaxID=314260 RepID=E0THL3_PARBH|nr:pentapeptide repeat-containing protein [Parvularcula bermudensis]ADM09309.1 hypothetical protein PB2503_06217 [Parvularcula bermudensis HTCC2503]
MGIWKRRKAAGLQLSEQTRQRINEIALAGDPLEARHLYSSAEPEPGPPPSDLDLKARAIALFDAADKPDAVERWDAFRKETDFEVINLSNVDFTKFPFPRGTDKGSFFGKRPIVGAYDFTNIDLDGANFAGLAFRRTNFSGFVWRMRCNFRNTRWLEVTAENCWFDNGWFAGAAFTSCVLEKCDFIGADMVDMKIQGTEIRAVTFFNANMEDTVWDESKILPPQDEPERRPQFDFCNLDRTAFTRCRLNASFNDAFMRRTDFTGSDLGGSSFFKTIYVRRELHGHFRDVENVEKIEGDPDCREDIINQVYFDDREFDDRDERREAFLRKRRNEDHEGAAPTRQGRVPLPRRISRFVKKEWRPVGNYLSLNGIAWGALWGALLAIFLADFSPRAVFSWGSLIPIFLTALFLALASSRRGRTVGFRIWRLLDYGRDWDRVLVLAMVVIGVIGVLYAWRAPDDLCYVQSSDIVPNGGRCAPITIGSADASGLQIYPWYVATIGFATLGIVDLVEPKTTLGTLLVSANALAGYAVLGLFLAVVQASFLRRHPHTRN